MYDILVVMICDFVCVCVCSRCGVIWLAVTTGQVEVLIVKQRSIGDSTEAARTHNYWTLWWTIGLLREAESWRKCLHCYLGGEGRTSYTHILSASHSRLP